MCDACGEPVDPKDPAGMTVQELMLLIRKWADDSRSGTAPKPN